MMRDLFLTITKFGKEWFLKNWSASINILKKLAATKI